MHFTSTVTKDTANKRSAAISGRPPDRIRPAPRLGAANCCPVVQATGSVTHLLERDASLKALTDALREAAAGTGRVALVHGEAGIGKTTLVESFLAAHRGEARML